MKNVVSLLADWANGIFAVLIASWWFGVDPLWWHFLVGLVLGGRRMSWWARRLLRRALAHRGWNGLFCTRLGMRGSRKPVPTGYGSQRLAALYLITGVRVIISLEDIS